MDEEQLRQQELAELQALGITPASTPDTDEQSRELAELAALGITPATSAPQPESQPEQESDLVGAAVRGLKTSLAPHLLTKKDLEGERSAGEIATEIGTSVGSDIVTGAALGSVVGSVVPGPGTVAGAAVGAVAAPIALALYRGLGYEYARSKAQGEDFNAARGILNSAAEVNPLISKGGKLLKAVTQAGLEAGREYSYSGDAKGAALSGALGGTFAGAFHRNGPGWFMVLGDISPGSQTKATGRTKAEVANLAEAVADDSPAGVGGRIERLQAEAVAADPTFYKLGDKLTSEAHAEEALAFKKFFLNQPGMKSDDVDADFAHYQATLGKDKIEQAYEIFKRQKVALEAVKQYDEDVLKELAPQVRDPISNGIADKVRDIKFVMRKVDRKIGTNFDGMIDKFTEAKNKHSQAMTPYLQAANKLVQQGRKAGLDNRTIGRWLAEDPTVQLDGDKLKIAEGWQSLFEEARQHLNREGFKVDFLSSSGMGRYFPSSAVSGGDMATQLRREVAMLKKDLGPSYLESADSVNIRKVAGELLGKDPSDIKYTKDINDAIEAALDPRKRAKGYEAGATFKREGVVPEFARDFDVGSVFGSYINTNFKAAHYHDAFAQLNGQMEVLRSLGFDETYKYLDKYMQHISGAPSDAMAKAQMKINQYKTALDKFVDERGPDSAAGKAAGLAKRAPDLLGFAVGQIYPNLLGWNFRAAIRNYAQPLLLTAPELGGDYGTKLVGKASAKAVADKARGVNYEEFLQQKNLAPGKFFGEAGDITEGGLRSVKNVGAGVEVLEKANNASMWLYSKSDHFNRYITYQVGQQLAKDMIAGNKRALDFAKNKLSAGGKASVRKLLAEGREEELGDEVARYLISKTQFNYGKESLNEFGREYGRLASMFTKWPAMIISDSADQIDAHGLSKGTANVLRRYMAPWAALALTQVAMDNAGSNPVSRYLLGDLKDVAPSQSFDISEVRSPPLQTASKFIAAALKADGEKLVKAAKDTALTYTPAPGINLLQEYRRFNRAMQPKD